MLNRIVYILLIAVQVGANMSASYTQKLLLGSCYLYVYTQQANKDMSFFLIDCRVVRSVLLNLVVYVSCTCLLMLSLSAVSL